MIQEDAKRPLLETGEFTEDELQRVVLELDAQSARLRTFVDATKSVSGSWFNPVMTFTRKELDQSGYF
ncbi:MAG: hypothetical protein E4H01_07960 [Lysobacterales bacterium]|nr:MAG: hypothetical protein E4H01_07960 [Xanthomonadales bacterium]